MDEPVVSKPEKREWEIKRDAEASERANAIKDFWLGRVLVTQRVIEKVSGLTGEILRIHDWGVEVWVPDMSYSRQKWTWPMLAMRFPRLIKRYPRPFRFARETPSEQCHCKIGKMVVEGENQVRCTRCKFLVGNESFPNRIRRATLFLRKEYDKSYRRRKVSKRVDRRKKPKTSRPRKKRKVTRRLVVRPGRRKEKKRNGQVKERRNPKIPEAGAAPISPPQEQAKQEVLVAKEITGGL